MPANEHQIEALRIADLWKSGEIDAFRAIEQLQAISFRQLHGIGPVIYSRFEHGEMTEMIAEKVDSNGINHGIAICHYANLDRSAIETALRIAMNPCFDYGENDAK